MAKQEQLEKQPKYLKIRLVVCQPIQPKQLKKYIVYPGCGGFLNTKKELQEIKDGTTRTCFGWKMKVEGPNDLENTSGAYAGVTQLKQNLLQV